MPDERDPDLVNPDWKRTRDWPWEEDHDSPKWKRRWARSQRKIAIGREKWGFQTCPECGVMHTALTLVCRGCGHVVKITDEQKAEAERLVTEELGDGSEFAPARVPIIYDPDVPKEQPALFIAVRAAALKLHNSMTAYLMDGDLNAIRRAANELLFESAARTKTAFADMMGAAINMRHPLTDEQRQQAKEELYISGSADL